MKNTFFLIFLASLFFGCKTENKKNAETEKEQSILEKVAHAHGFDHWKKVTEIHFTFNVDRDSTHFERSWVWHPKTNDVEYRHKNDTVIYNRHRVDSLSMVADKGFINDKYWLLSPFNLIWDKGFTYEHSEKATAPISMKELQKLTIVYGNEGGYTPGDAYDFYFGDDYLIQEWTYRKGNTPEPSLTTTWEGYKDLNGIKIATVRNRDTGNWKLYFTELSVEVK
ncbi:hypothetical protein [Leptobacterium sp. I13]|uniref:hypothetical protein n=1 Tax=Leptobacterium meishanense TaxID=3128904 RepID=UPI0030EE77C5